MTIGIMASGFTSLRCKTLNEKEIEAYTYDEYGQLISYKDNKNNITTYSYYPDGLRATKTNQGKTTTYYTDDENVITETENGNFTATNIFGINPIARQDASGKTYYYLYNAHGDVVALSDEAGSIINTYDYDIYGNAEETKESVSNPIRYAGEYQDNESGLYYLRAGYYDSDLGRFISEDTDDGEIEDPLSLNLYTYCAGNPITYTDPSGHSYNPKYEYYDYTPTPPSEHVTWRWGYNYEIDGWRVRFDKKDPSCGEYYDYIHIEEGRNKYSQNSNGSKHKGGSTDGSPTNSIKKQIKKKFGWDWDKNAKNKANEDAKKKEKPKNQGTKKQSSNKKSTTKITPTKPIIPVIPLEPIFPFTIPEIPIPEIPIPIF